MFIEFHLLEGQKDSEFKGIDKIGLSKEQFGMFIPIREEENDVGCKLFLNNGGTVNVQETYDEIRWMTGMHTIAEYNNRVVEMANLKDDPYKVDINGKKLGEKFSSQVSSMKPPLD